MFESFKDKDVKLNYVKIEEENIKKFSESFNTSLLKIPEWKEDVFLIKDSEIDVNFIFLINTINFSFWNDLDKEKWTFDFDNKIYSGSFALFSALKQAFLDDYPIFYPKFLKDISEEDLRNILCKKTEIPMFKERLLVLRSIGRDMIDNDIDSFVRILNKASKSVITLIGLLDKYFPSFRDKYIYKMRKFDFYKRAQLICSMLYGRYQGKSFGEFYNIDKLTVFADYRIPQALRKLGLITYCESLSKKIENKVYIQEGSKEELEIRFSSVLASEILKVEINKFNKSNVANSLNLDYFLWKTGKEITKKSYNFHRTRSIYY